MSTWSNWLKLQRDKESERARELAWAGQALHFIALHFAGGTGSPGCKWNCQGGPVWKCYSVNWATFVRPSFSRTSQFCCLNIWWMSCECHVNVIWMSCERHVSHVSISFHFNILMRSLPAPDPELWCCLGKGRQETSHFSGGVLHSPELSVWLHVRQDADWTVIKADSCYGS